MITDKAEVGDVIVIPSEPNSKYVVEEAKKFLPDGADYFGWYVVARRLNPNGTYYQHGHEIKFFQSGGYKPTIPQVEVVGKMIKEVNFRPVKMPIDQDGG